MPESFGISKTPTMMRASAYANPSRIACNDAALTHTHPQEIRELFYWGAKDYFTSWLNIFELINIFIFGSVFVFRMFAFAELDAIEENFSDERSYVEIEKFASYAQISMNLLAMNALISYMKSFKYLKFHRGITQFVDTIFQSTYEVTVFIVIMVVIVISYALAFYMAFGHVSRGYMDFPESLLTLFKSTMGQFTIRASFRRIFLGVFSWYTPAVADTIHAFARRPHVRPPGNSTSELFRALPRPLPLHFLHSA